MNSSSSSSSANMDPDDDEMIKRIRSLRVRASFSRESSAHGSEICRFSCGGRESACCEADLRTCARVCTIGEFECRRLDST